MDKFQSQFADIVTLINESRNKAIKAVNTELINLYWNVGAYISKKIDAANWGEKTVDELALFIRKNHPELKGFTRSGLFRMRQFYETYSQVAIVSPLRTQLQGTENKDFEIVAPVVRQLGNKDLNEIQIVASSGRQFETDDIRNTIFSISKTAMYLNSSIYPSLTTKTICRKGCCAR